MAEHGRRLVGPFPGRVGTDPGAQAEYDRLRRRALWAMPSGLYLVGSRAAGRRNLMAANWVTQLAFEPKLIGASIERDALTLRLVLESGGFSVSLLSREDRALIRHFAKPAVEGPGPDELGGIPVDATAGGFPFPRSALAVFECRLDRTAELGDHTLCVGEVIDVGFGLDEGTPVLRMEDTRMSYGG